MANGGRINYTIGFSVDSQGALKTLERTLIDIQVKAQSSGAKMRQEYQASAEIAKQLSKILDQSYNKDLGTINVNRFNRALQKSNLNLRQVQSSLAKVPEGARAYNLLASQILKTNIQLKQTNKWLDEMAITMANTVRWGVTSSIFNAITSSISKAYSYSKQLNNSLTDIRIVTGKTADEMDRFAESANKAAKNLATSTTNYTNASLIYYQQGLSDEEVKARTDTTIKAANVTGQSADEVSEQLTAVWNGYKVSAQEAELYVDKLAAVAATTAADLEELSTGMSKVASAANIMGVDIDQLNAQLATVVSVTRQAPESVGTAFKTIYARMGDIEAGLDTETTLGEYTKKMNEMGFNVLDTNGKLRDMGSVIEEIGNKWTDLSREQQVALSQVMAGTRQYNNLLALFDNWDMYTNALNTSADAAGTLQKQQDIYFESTEAHLDVLKATWEDVYAGLVDSDELNAGIDLVTQLAQTVDNFFDSFGGGIKSIAAFGAIVANIFNKQISSAIANAIMNQDKFNQNIALLKFKEQAITGGAISISPEASAQDQAIYAGLEKQIQYAEKIKSVKAGITSEEYNQLTALQQQIGALVQEATLIEETALQEAQKLGLSREKLLSEEGYIDSIYEEVEIAQISAELTQKEISAVEAQLTSTKDLVGLKFQDTELSQTLLSVQSSLTDKIDQQGQKASDNLKVAKQQLDSLIDKTMAEKDALKSEEKVRNLKKQILELMQKINAEEKKNIQNSQNRANAAEKVQNATSKSADIKSQAGVLDAEFEESMTYASRAASVAEKVTTVSTTMSTLAMSWSSVNMMFQTWGDESASLGDKITQTFMTLGFIIPSVLNSFKNLNATLGYTTTLSELHNLNLEKKNALLATQAASARVQNQNELLSNILLTAKGKLESKNNLTEQERLALTALQNGEDKEAIAILGAMTPAQLKEIGLNEAMANGLIKTKLAQDGLNASMLANPAMWIIAALGGIIAILAAYTNAMEEAKKARKELNKAEYEAYKTDYQDIIEENKSQLELYQTYIKMKSALDDSFESKEQLKETTEELCKALGIEWDALDKVQNKYDEVNESILKARKTEIKEAIDKTQKALNKNKEITEDVVDEAIGDEYDFGTSEKVTSNGREEYVYFNVEQGASSSDEEIINNALADYLEQNYSDLIQPIQGQGAYRGKSVQFQPGVSQETVLSIINEFYDYLLENEDTLQYDKEDSEAFQWFKKIATNENINTHLEEQEQQKTDLENQFLQLAEIDAQMFQASNDPSSIDTIEKLESYQNDFIEYFKKNAKEYGLDISNYTEKDFQELAENYLSGFDNLKDVYLEQDLFESLEKKLLPSNQKETIDSFSDSIGVILEPFRKKFFPTEEEKDITNNITDFLNQVKSEGNLELLATIDFDEYKTLETIKAKYEVIKTQAKLEDIEIQLDVSKNTIENLINGKELTDKQIESLQELEKEYPQLASIQDKTSKAYLENLIAIREELEKEKIQIKENLRNFSISEIQEIDISTEINDKDLQKFQDKLKNIVEQDYQVVVEIKADIQSDFDSVTSVMENLNNISSKIGENFIVAANDIEELNDAFPGILAGIEFLEDGTAQLNEEAVNAAMEAAKREASADTYTTIQKLENQKIILEQKRDAAYQIADIATKLANGDIKLTEVQSDLNENLNILKTTNDEETAKVEQENAKNVAEQAIVSSESMAQNFASAYEAMAADSQRFAEIAKQNLIVATTGQGDTISTWGDNFNTEWKAKNTETGTVATTSAELMTYEDFDNADANYAQIAEAFTQLGDAYNDGVNNIIGKEAELLARSKTLFNNVGKIGTGSESEPSKKDYLEEDRDRYHDINIEIKKLTNNLEDLKTAEEHLTGKDLINNLNQQLKILDKTVARQREKLKIQKQEQKELQAQLKSQGVKFDEDGTIANYNTRLNEKMQAVNKAIATYNSFQTKEEQEAYEETLEAIEKDYEEFKEKIERYEELVYDDMQDLEQEIADNISEQISLKIQAFDETVKIELDFTDAKKSWIEFKKELDLAESDIFGRSKFDIKSIKQLLEDIKTYQWSADTTIQDYKEGKAGSENSRFYVDGVFDKKAAMEALREEQENLQNALLAANQKINEVQRSYLDMLDQVQEKLDKQMAGYEHINELINHGLKLTELLSGEDSYKEKSTYYSKMATNYKDQIEMARKEKELWDAEIARAQDAVTNATTDQEREIAQEQLDKVVENWRNATNELNSLVEAAIENLQAQYENSIDQALQEMTEKFTNGKSLDYISKEWELINDNADRYLDTVNSTYEVQALEAKYMNAIDSTDSISAQKKLNKAMEEELAALREKDKLTQYDIDRANKKLDITMKQIALEEAQANKSTMRLRRDAQGNYSYQFVADEDEIAKAQQDLLAAQNDLYNFDKEAYEKNLDEAYQAYVQFQEDLKKAAMINDPKERAAYEALIREQYEQKITDLTAINETIRGNLQSSAFEALSGMYNTNEENFKLMNDDILADFSTLTIEDMPNLMGQLVEGWNTGIQQMITSFAGEGGFSAQCQAAYAAIKAAQDVYQNSLKDLKEASGKTFDDIESDIDKDIDKTNDFIEKNNDLIDQIKNDLDKQWKLMTKTLAKLREEYEKLEKAAKAALDEMMRIQNYEHKKNTIIKDDDPTNDNPTSPNSPSNPKKESEEEEEDNPKKGKGEVPSADIMKGVAACIWYGTGAGGWENNPGRKAKLTEKFTSEGQQRIQGLLNNKQTELLNWAKQKGGTNYNQWLADNYSYSKFDTGGYTGEWGAEGRMAMLHEKEIVLNKQDTANILSAVSIVRGIGDLINNLSANLLGSLSQKAIDSTLGIRDFEQNVHITAEFPNVSSSSEIEDALRNLTNVAAQRAFNTRI